jgi:hypothetical protein
VGAPSKVVPLAQKAKYATVAGTANNAKALGGRPAPSYPRLGSNGKLPNSLITMTGGAGATGAAGPQGPKGPAGPKGDPGQRGEPGPPGLVSAYSSPIPSDGIYRASDGSTAASLALPAGRYVIIGRVLVANAQGLSPPPARFYGACTLSAEGDTDCAQVRGPDGISNGSAGVIPATMIVIHQFKSNGTATIRCNTSGTGEPSTWANARITALQVANTATPITGAASGASGTKSAKP